MGVFFYTHDTPRGRAIIISPPGNDPGHTQNNLPGLAGGGRPASSPRCAFRTRNVRFALENDGWNCTFECEVHLSAPGGAQRRRPARGPRRRRLSKSVAKAPIAPERRRRIVDIPRFFSRPIPARGAFATDLDNRPTRTASGAPPAPPCAHSYRTAAPIQTRGPPFPAGAGGRQSRFIGVGG